jgi:hypothetical protein
VLVNDEGREMERRDIDAEVRVWQDRTESERPISYGTAVRRPADSASGNPTYRIRVAIAAADTFAGSRITTEKLVAMGPWRLWRPHDSRDHCASVARFRGKTQ